MQLLLRLALVLSLVFVLCVNVWGNLFLLLTKSDGHKSRTDEEAVGRHLENLRKLSARRWN